MFSKGALLVVIILMILLSFAAGRLSAPKIEVVGEGKSVISQVQEEKVIHACMEGHHGIRCTSLVTHPGHERGIR
jgi:hypothetical protein